MLVSLVAGIGTKLVLLFAFYQWYSDLYKEKLQALLVSWMSSYAGMVLCMLILSPFGWVSRWPLMVMMLALALGLLGGTLKRNGRLRFDLDKLGNELFGTCEWLNTLCMAAMVVMFALLIFHNVYYYDNTSDGMMQGMPKLAFIQQAGSLFVRYNTPSPNIFANECLGEMNGLYYLLFTLQDEAILAGNSEIWLMSYFGFLYAVRSFGYRGKLDGVLALSCSMIPVMTGIAMTLKTDLISMILPVVSVVLLFEYYRNQTSANLFAAILFLGAMAASKITVLPLAGLLLIGLVLFYFTRAKERPVLPVLCGGFLFVVMCNRYVINLLQYGNPFIRPANEKMSFSLSNFMGNLQGIIESCNEIPELIATIEPRSISNFVLIRGMGYSGWLFIGLVCFGVVFALWKLVASRNRRPKGKDFVPTIFVWIPFALALIFVMFSTVWYAWSFRYLAGYVLTMYLLLGALLFSALKANGNWFKILMSGLLAVLMICLSTANGIYNFRYGQAIPTSLEVQRQYPSTIRKLLYSDVERIETWQDDAALLHLFENGGTGLVMIEFSVPFYQYFGDDNCVKIDMAGTQEELLEWFESGEYDLVAVASTHYQPDQYSDLESALSAAGYVRCTIDTAGVFLSPNAIQRYESAVN